MGTFSSCKRTTGVEWGWGRTLELANKLMKRCSHPMSSEKYKLKWVTTTQGFPDGSVVKKLPANAGDARDAGLILWKRKWQPIPVFFPGKSQGQRSLAGYSPWSCKELDTIERARARTHTHTHTKSPIAIRTTERARARARMHTHTHTHTHMKSPIAIRMVKILNTDTTKCWRG